MLNFDQEEDFVGREEVMGEIGRRFDTNANRVALTGIGGVGYVSGHFPPCLLHS